MCNYFLHTYAHTHIYINKYTCVYLHIYVYIYIYMCIYIYICKNTYFFANICILVYKSTHMYMDIHIHVYIYIHIMFNIYVCMLEINFQLQYKTGWKHGFIPETMTAACEGFFSLNLWIAPASTWSWPLDDVGQYNNASCFLPMCHTLQIP